VVVSLRSPSNLPRGHRVRWVAIALSALLAATGASARAATIPGIAIDGPSADIAEVARVDVARDGTGALAYVKKVAGKDHVFVARLAAGAWSAPVQVDAGLPAANESRRPAVAAANGGRVVVTFVNSAAATGPGDLEGVVAPSSGAAFGAPTTVFATNALDADLDTAPTGTLYAAISAANGGSFDVRAAQLAGTTWTPVGGPAAVLDFDPTKEAGEPGTQRGPRVAVAKDGASAVVTWTESPTAGEYHVYARRLTGTLPTAIGAAQLADVPTLGAANTATAGGDMADVDVDGTGAAWVVFRQLFTYGATDRPRILARRFPGAAFDAGVQVLDGLGDSPTEGAEFPRIDVDDAGDGLVATPRQLTFGVFGSALGAGTWSPGFKVDATDPTAPAAPVAALGENGAGLIGWVNDPGGGAPRTVLARTRAAGTLGPELTLSAPAFGTASAGALDAAADASGNTAVVFTQGAAGDRRVVAALVAAAAPAPAPAPGPAPGPVADRTAPSISGLRFTRTRFALGSGLPRIVSRPAGATTLALTLSEAATVTLRLERLLAGRRVGTRCRSGRASRAHRRCVRARRVGGRAALTAPKGAVLITFAGRLRRRGRLAPGRYRLVVTARDAAGNVALGGRVRFTLARAG